MTKENFKRIVGLLEAHSYSSQMIYKHGIETANFTNDLQEVISILMKEAFGEEADDWISWWLYEKDFGKREDIKAYDKDGTEILDTIDELYDYIVELKNKKSDGKY
jgi:hypothetical protein